MSRLVSITTLALIGLVGQGGVAAGEKPVTVKTGYPFSFGFGAAPKTLSRSEPRPVEMLLSVRTEWSAALKELQLRLDRDIRLDASGIPPCSGNVRAIRVALPEVEERCRESIVGRGDTKMTIAFPDQPPISIASDVLVLGGAEKAGVSTFYALAYIKVPTPQMIAISLKARKDLRGRYGTLVEAQVPVIAGGYGRIEQLDLGFGKRASRGKREGVATATCTRGSLKAEAVASFRDGSSWEGSSLRPCVPVEPTR